MRVCKTYKILAISWVALSACSSRDPARSDESPGPAISDGSIDTPPGEVGAMETSILVSSTMDSALSAAPTSESGAEVSFAVEVMESDTSEVSSDSESSGDGGDAVGDATDAPEAGQDVVAVDSAPHEVSTDPSTLVALRAQLAASTPADVVANMPRYRPLCDGDGYPLVGNLVRKLPEEYQPSDYCALLRSQGDL